MALSKNSKEAATKAVDTLNRLEELIFSRKGSGDEEDMHLLADEQLLSVLDASELSEVSDAWREARKRVGFWYA